MSVMGELSSYRFDGFVLDIARGSLVNAAGKDVPLRHNSYRLLCLFVSNAGRLLERDVIARTIWPSVVVADDGITQCVRDIRRALGDDTKTKIRTILRRGYVFTAEITAARDGDRPSKDGTTVTDRPSVAVMPFANMSGDASQDYLGDGVADCIITELSRNHCFVVIARTSSFIYKHRPVTVQQIAQQLGVQYVIDGSVRRDEQCIRITVQLISAKTATHIWAQRFDHSLSNLFAAQDEIAQAIAAAIDPAIAHVERGLASQKPPASLTAWQAWQRALWHWSRGSDLAMRRTFLQRAIELDPAFAPAHAMLVWLYLSEGTLGTGLPLDEAVRLAEVEARIALDLDPHSSIAHAAQAWVLDHQGRAKAALEAAAKAIDLNPNDPQGHLVQGRVMVMSGRPAEAQNCLATALRLDPRGPTAPAAMHNRAVGYYLGRDYLSAEATMRRSILDYPEHPRAYVWLAAALGQLGHAAARAALNDAVSVAPDYLKYKTSKRAPYMRRQDHQHLLDGLRKAGWEG